MLNLLVLLGSVCLAHSCTSPREPGEKCEGGTPKMSFYYDEHTGHCQPFFYKGCRGNENRFATRDECVRKCMKGTGMTGGDEKNNIVEVCSLTTDAKLSDVAKACSSDDACDKHWKCTKGYCCPTKEYTCHLPANQGTQHNGQVSKARKFVWLQGVSNCLPFSYFGVDGNFNNFGTYDACIAYCKP